jgi:hypothetical protein
MLFNLAYGLVTKAAANRQSPSAHIEAKRRVFAGTSVGDRLDRVEGLEMKGWPRQSRMSSDD